MTLIRVANIFITIFIGLFVNSSCSESRKENTEQGKAKIKTTPPDVVVLKTLPDSAKPVISLLQEIGKPESTITNAPASVHLFIDPFTHKPKTPEAQGIGFFKNFTADQGLPLDAINCSIIDKTGNIWFGTQGGGVTRYDGKKFTTYTNLQGLAPNNTILCITEDKYGNIWFGSFGGGLSRYDGKSFTNYTTAQGLPNNYVNAIAEDKSGNIWIGTRLGVSRYDGKSFTNYTTAQGLPNNYVGCITVDKSGNIWFGTLNGSISQYDGKSFTNYTINQELANNLVRCILQDKKGNLWFGTDAGGASRFDGKNFFNYTTAEGLPNNAVYKIAEDKNGDLWFGTRGGGVSRYDGRNFINFTAEQGLANNFIQSITEDAIGNIWFGSFGGGVSRYEGKSFISYTTRNGLADNNIFYTTKDKDGNLWFGSNRGGVSRYDGKSFINYTVAQGLAANRVNACVPDKAGNLWFGTTGGVSCYNGKSFKNYISSAWLSDNEIRTVFEDKKGNLWFGTRMSGISCYDGKQITHYTMLQGLVNNSILCITEDNKGNLWFGSNGGVSRYDGKSFTNYTTAQGLANDVVYWIAEDKTGNLWFATFGGGVSRYDGENFNNYTVAQGLPDNIVTSIIPDSASNIIIGTNSGFAVLTSFNANLTEDNRKEEVIPAQNNLSNEQLKEYTPQIEIYNSSTGYPVQDVTHMFMDSGGIIWIATGSDKTGLVRFDYKAIHKNLKPLTVILQSIKINNENICWNDLLPASHIWEVPEVDSNTTAPNVIEEATTLKKLLNSSERDSMENKFGDIKFDSITPWYPIPQNLILPYAHNTISFDFNAIETQRNSLVKYQYKLEGYDRDWNPVTNQSTATFGNIPEGTYTFKLKAQNAEGTWSEPLVYTFRILPPWYRSWWAYSVYIILFISMIRVFVKWRIKALIKEKKALVEKLRMQNALIEERSRISRELHDEVGATLSGIAMYSHMTKQQIKNANTAEVERSLNIMQQSSGEMVNKLNDIVWLINPEQDSLPKLIQRLEEYARDMCAIKGMKVVLNLPAKMHPVDLSIESRRNIYLFCKEAINNAVKYSEGSTLELSVKESNGMLEFSVTDNGKGFDEAMIKKGNGLGNMEKRAKEMNATYSLRSAKEKGTSLSLKYKIT